MVEQLWYTWSTTGLGHNVGFQPRAASAGLREINSKRYQEFRTYLNYYLPDESDVFASTNVTAPVTLAFLDISKAAKPAHYKNTHMVIRKVYKGLDDYGRPGNFFIHLADNLKEDFVASDAIDLWDSGFWASSDKDNPSLSESNHSLPQLQDTDLLAGPFDIQRSNISGYESFLHRYLPYVIQAFLSLKPTQKLYIQAPSDRVAILIWGLAHSLPKSLQQKLDLTFSTYEKDVSRFPARVVGTCRATVLANNSRGSAQQLLPSNAFSGIGPALALDCDNNQWANLSKTGMASETTNALVEYAQEATARLLNNKSAKELAKKLELANKQKIEDVVAFLSFVKTHIYEKPLEKAEVDAKLHNPRLAALDLSGSNTRNSFLKHYKEQSEWRKEKALPALKNLRAVILDAKNTELTREERGELNDAFFLLAQDTVEEFVENLRYLDDNDKEDDLFEAWKDLLDVLLFTNTEIQIKATLLQNAQQYVRQPDFQHIQQRLDWSKRFWLLQQAMLVHNAQAMSIDTELIWLWLPRGWSSLRLFLEAKERFPEEWRSLAASQVIQATWISYRSFTKNSADAYWLLEKHYTTLFGPIEALGTVGVMYDMLQDANRQESALKFCTHLLSMIVKRKRGFWDALGYFRRKVMDIVLFIPRQFIELGKDIRHWFGRGQQSQGDLILDWKMIVLPVLQVQIKAPDQPINLDELLENAYLREEDHDFLLKEHYTRLLTSSHQLSPYVIKMCRTFLDLLAGEVLKQEHKSNLQQFYDPNVNILERLRQCPFPDESMRIDVLDLLYLLVTTREKAFEWYRSQDQAFLSNLAHAISSFHLTKNADYMGNLYWMILKKPRSIQDWNATIDQLASIFDSEKSHPEGRRKIFEALLDYTGTGNGKYIFPLEMLLIFIQLAFMYASNLQEKSQKKFLEPALKSIDSTRPRNLTFKALDKEVQKSLASRPDYLDLWKKYSPGDSKQVVSQDGTAKAQQPEPQTGQPASFQQPNESSAAKPNDQALADQRGNALRQPEKKIGNGSSDVPGRPTPAQSPAQNQGDLSPTSWGNEQGQAAANNMGDPRAYYQPTQPASTNTQGQPYPPAGDQQSMQPESQMQGQAYPPASSGQQFYQQGGNLMSGQGNQPVSNYQSQQPSNWREFDVLSIVFGQYFVTKQKVGELAFAFKEYVDWRIPLLSKEHVNKHKGEATNASYYQPDKVQAEKDMLEELKFINDHHKQIQRLLENSILIQVTLENNVPEALQMYQSSLEDDYAKLQKSPGYTNRIKKANEGDIHYLFEICMRYCALSAYIQQKGIIYENTIYKDIKQWIEMMRGQAVRKNTYN